MIICIDFDGVIADTGVLKREWVRMNCDPQFVLADTCRSMLEPLIGKKMYSCMQKELGFEDTLLARPLAGAVAALHDLRKIARLHLVSARSPEKLAWAIEWMKVNGVDAFDGVHSALLKSKGDIAANLLGTWLIDDDKGHLERLPKGVRGIKLGGQPLDLSYVKFASHWDEVKKILIEEKGDHRVRS